MLAVLKGGCQKGTFSFPPPLRFIWQKTDDPLSSFQRLSRLTALIVSYFVEEDMVSGNLVEEEVKTFVLFYILSKTEIFVSLSYENPFVGKFRFRIFYNSCAR